MLSRTKLTPAETYRTAMDRANDVVPLYNHTIRLNHLILNDDRLAQKLARAGRPLTLAAHSGAAAMRAEDLFGEYVNYGARFCFGLLQRVIDPSNRVFGPGNFSIVPCDAEGTAISGDGISAGEQLKTPRISFGHALGEKREDYYQAAAVDIASRIVAEGRTTKPSAIQKAVEVAARQNCDARVYSALATAAVRANAIMGANQAVFADGKGLGGITLGVLVEPMPGHEVPADMPYDRLITLDLQDL